MMTLVVVDEADVQLHHANKRAREVQQFLESQTAALVVRGIVSGGEGRVRDAIAPSLIIPYA